MKKINKIILIITIAFNVIQNVETHSKEIITCSATQILTPARFDIMAKYIYAKHYDLNVQSKWAENLYHQHLHVWNGCKEKYPTRDIPHFECAKQYLAKNGIEEYKNAFHDIIHSVKKDGLDLDQSILPINTDYSPVDGAHRTAALLLYKKPATCMFFNFGQNHSASSYNFRTLGVEEKHLDNMALEYACLKKNTFIFTVFPSAVGHHSDIQRILKKYGSIVYEKQFYMKNEGPLNLIKCLYDGEGFAGGWFNNFGGSRIKKKLCFPEGSLKNPVRIFLCECESVHNATAAKKEIRKIFQISNHSVHVNDTHEETVRIAQAVFNKNSIHFLNNCHAKYFKNFEKFLAGYKKWLDKNGYDKECFCIDGSAIMSAYGLRDCNDLDFIHHGYNECTNSGVPYLGSHNGHEMQYHAYTKDDIIFNPDNHFYYKGVKFGALHVINAMKSRRGEPKDHQDVQLMKKPLKG